MGPFARKRGGLEMRIGEAEAEILGQVVRELIAQIETPERPGHLWRLFPPAYTDDDAASREFSELVGDDLVRQRLRALDDVKRALDAGRARRGLWTVLLDDDQVSALVGVLNDARLALGTRLAVTEETDDSSFDEDSPEGFAYMVYRWLSWLQSFLVDELLEA